MIIRHNFRSGNSCDIHVPEVIKTGAYNNTDAEWENWPPSEADLNEFYKEVYPDRVIPLLEQIVQKVHGTGRIVEIMPGIRGSMPDR